MISDLWEIYKKPAIKAAIDLLSADKRVQVMQWITQLVIVDKRLRSPDFSDK